MYLNSPRDYEAKRKMNFFEMLKSKKFKVLLYFPHIGFKIPKHFYKGLQIEEHKL